MPNWNPFRRKAEASTKPVRAYLIDPPNYKSLVLADPQCGLTGILCPVCTQWGSDAWYPTVDCSMLADLDEDISKYIRRIPPGRQPWTPMEIDEFKELAERLAPILGQERPIHPGTIFGQALGDTKGEIGDFAWQTRVDAYVRESVFQEIQEASFPVVGVPAKLKFQKDPGERLIQLELRPTARLASSYWQCEVCGRIKVNLPLIIDGASFDDSIPIQSIYECSNTAVVSAAFADFINERGLTDISLSPIEVT